MLREEQKKSIQTSYSRFTGREGFKPRYGQRVMIAEIAKYLGAIETNSEGLRKSDPKVCVVEAGTGTGKTLAYTISVLPLAIADERKVVISTATTALQEQVIAKDLPDLSKHSGLNFSYALAKGRGRYICLSKVDQQLEGLNVDQSALPLFLLENTATELNQDTLEGFLSAYASGDWDGDRDTWPKVIEQDIWRAISTDNQQCSNRRCSYFSSCPYYEARNRWEDADVVVANHDLVLSDLSLGGGVILPAPDSSIYVFDEAHHLADKALGHFAVGGGLKSTQSWMKSLAKSLAEFAPYLGPGNHLARNIEEIAASTQLAHEHIEQLYESLATGLEWESDDGGRDLRYRFVEGGVPESVLAVAQELKLVFATVVRQLDELRNEVTKAVDEKSDCGLSKDEGEQWYPVFGSLCNRAEAVWDLWQFYAKEQSKEASPNARWAILREADNQSDVYLYGSPLSAGDLLYHNLWKSSYASVLTSATLTALGSFRRLEQKAGLPNGSSFHRVVSPFDFANVAQLRVPQMAAAPNEQERHTQEIAERLESFIGDDEAVLVLFSSRKQMNDVFYQCPRELREDIVTQDDMGKQELLNHHKARIDNKERSILFGLASMAEGIDLPGAYLRHVVIAKIPFSVPNDPLEQSISEWLELQGRNPFMEVSVPDASLKLIQACGRLIRTEADHGVITILDNRLVTRRYGKMLLDALPPYKRFINC